MSGEVPIEVRMMETGFREMSLGERHVKDQRKVTKYYDSSRDRDMLISADARDMS